MATSQIFKRYQYVYTSRKHILEMLEDRGFDIGELTNYTQSDMKIMLNSHTQGKFESKSEVGPLDIFLEKKNDNETGEKEQIYVKYRLDDKFKRTANLQLQITEIFENLLTSKDTLIILNVGRVIIKPGAKEKPSEDFVNHLYISKGYFVQLFGLENFLFNVNRHVFVPKHRIISKKELHDFIEHYSCTVKNIPTIKRDDPQAKYIGLRPKQVCEITVVNLTSGTTVRYRICVL